MNHWLLSKTYIVGIQVIGIPVNSISTNFLRMDFRTVNQFILSANICLVPMDTTTARWMYGERIEEYDEYLLHYIFMYKTV